MSADLRTDPFPLTPAVAHYVPRPATEAALGALTASLERGARVVELDAEPGLGKTLLLHLLQKRLPDAMQAVYLPYPKLAEDGFWAWVATELGLRGNPLVAVLRRAAELDDEGRALVLLVDDAAHLPSDTRGALLQAACGGRGVRVVLGGIDPASEPTGERVTLAEAMTRSETDHYLRARLASVELPDHVRLGFDDETVGRLHLDSAGNPARLHQEAAELLRRRLVAGPTTTTSTAPKPAVRVTDRKADSSLPDPFPVLPSNPPWRRMAAGVVELGARIPERAAWAAAGLIAGIAIGAGGSALLSQGARAPAAAPAPTPILSLEEAVRESSPPPQLTGPAEGLDVAAPPPLEPPQGAPTNEDEPISASETAPRYETAAVIGRREPPSESTRVSEAAPEPRPLPALEPVHLNVNATPWATITLDGEAIGETPLGEVPIQRGAHQLSATLPDGTVIEKTIEAEDEDLFLVFP